MPDDLDPTVPIGWATPEQARRDWPDAPKSAVSLASLLTVAYEVCSAYAPATRAVPDPRPPDYVPAERLVRAQILHARAVWTAARVNASGTLGIDDPVLAMAVSTTTLDAKIRQLLRPGSGLPDVG